MAATHTGNAEQGQIRSRVSYEAAAVGDYVGDHRPGTVLRWSVRYKADVDGKPVKGVLATFLERCDADEFIEKVSAEPGAERLYLLVDDTIGEVVARRDVDRAGC